MHKYALALLAMTVAAAAAPTVAPVGAQYKGVVNHVVDGDTVVVNVSAWKSTPFDPISVRVNGIDTPETNRSLAKCDLEIARAKAAQAYAETLMKPGDKVTIVYHSMDKYGGRIDADLVLTGGRSLAQLMLAGGYAKPYNGQGPKPDWCTP